MRRKSGLCSLHDLFKYAKLIYIQLRLYYNHSINVTQVIAASALNLPNTNKESIVRKMNCMFYIKSSERQKLFKANEDVSFFEMKIIMKTDAKEFIKMMKSARKSFLFPPKKE